MQPERRLNWAPALQRYARFVSGFWYGPYGTITTSSTLGNGTLRAYPLLVGSTTAFDLITVDVTSAGNAGATVRLGVYADDGTGYPGALLLDAGSVAADAIASPALSIALTLPAGLYWPAGAVQNAATTQPTLRIVSPPGYLMSWIGETTVAKSALSTGWTQASVTGALPSTFTTTPSPSSVPRIMLRAV